MLYWCFRWPVYLGLIVSDIGKKEKVYYTTQGQMSETSTKGFYQNTIVEAWKRKVYLSAVGKLLQKDFHREMDVRIVCNQMTIFVLFHGKNAAIMK